MFDRALFERILEEEASLLPDVFFEDLNGGIIISDEAPIDENSVADDLYIMGEYVVDGILGCSIVMYAGSFARLFRRVSEDKLREEIRSTLRHEFRHHLEVMSGERDLEIEDEEEFLEYLRWHEENPEPQKKERSKPKRHLPRFKRKK